MGIVVTCGKCGASFRAKDEHAGRRAKCPKCQTLMTIPAAAKPAASPPPTAVRKAHVSSPRPNAPPAKPSPPAAPPLASWTELLDEVPARPTPPRLPSGREILGAFRGTIEPVETSTGYTIAAAFVALGMVVLPLLYLGLLAALGYLIYYEVRHDHYPVLEPLLLIFMIKPLFSRSSEIDRGRSLTPTSDPLLFAFVERLCQAVGAPKPVRIDVDCRVNASAGFRRGVWSFAGDDLVLCIGVPLVAGLTLNEFAGVLAHEFGHFTQRQGSRLVYVIGMINEWFARVVYGRDAFDSLLVTLTTRLPLRMTFGLWGLCVMWALLTFFWVLRGAVWLSRRFLWVLMLLGYALAYALLRQKEYDADRYSVRLVGFASFQSAQRQSSRLGIAENGICQGLGAAYYHGLLADDLPRLVQAVAKRMPPEVDEVLDQMIAKERTQMFDSHPAIRERCANAEKENAPGLFHVNAPATVLFSNFSALSKNVTLDFYRGAIGPYFKATDLQSVEKILAKMDEKREG